MMDQKTFDKLEAQLALQILNLQTELAVARIDLLNSTKMYDDEKAAPAKNEPTKEVAAKSDGNLIKTTKKKPAKKKPETNKVNRGVDVEKVQEQVKVDTKKTAEDLGIKDEKPAALYKAGSVNLLGALADLNILSPEARAPYMKDAGKWVNQDQHPSALGNGVLHLDLVNEVIAGVNDKVEPISQQIPPQIAPVREKIGADLFDYMMERKQVAAAKDDLTVLYKAKS